MDDPVSIPSTDALVVQIEAEHAAAVGAAQNAIARAIRCGELLLKAKDQVEHGAWIAWVEANLSIGPRQASKYMRLARCARESNTTLETSFRSIDGALGAVAAIRDIREDALAPKFGDEPNYDDAAPPDVEQPPRPPSFSEHRAQTRAQIFSEDRAAAINQLKRQTETVAGKFTELRAGDPPASRALQLLKRALEAVDEDGAFPTDVRTQLVTLTSAVQAELARRLPAAPTGPGRMVH